MYCIKCRKEIPEGALYCPWCGKKQQTTKRPSVRRSNGLGTAYKRGRTWTASVILGYKTVTDAEGGEKRVPVKRTKGGFASKTEALAACAEIRKRPSLEAVKIPLFMEVYEQWEKAYLTQGKARGTLGCYRSARKHMTELDFYPFDAIGLDDLQQCVDDCPNGRRTKENMKTLFGLLYKYALPRHWTDMNYASFLRITAEEGGTHPPFTRTQVETIRKSIGTVPHAEDIYCLIYTGFRPTEFFALTADDYHDENGIQYLTGGIKTAAGKGRAVSVSSKILPIIRERVKNGGKRLFPRDGGEPMTAEYFRDNYFYPALAAMGIQAVPTKDSPAEYVPYSCRHTFSNLLKDAAGSDKDKAALMGHEDYKTTQRLYQSSDLEHIKAITDQL